MRSLLKFFLLLLIPTLNAFQSVSKSSRGKALFAHVPPPIVVNNPSHVVITEASPLNLGISKFLETPSVSVSLEERKAVTKEEIAQKKMTFNVIFWGGGFVAPFLATVFYFGFKFWEK